jgi:uncharacterized protein
MIAETRLRCGEVPAIFLRPDDAWCMFVYAHGAGVGMEHEFMESTARRLAEGGVATLRYNFPYMDMGGWPPDRPPVLIEAVRSMVGAADGVSEGLPLFAGGKSLGGRMTSNAAALAPLQGVLGLVFMGFPLHPTKRPGIERAEHLDAVEIPMLFLQGTRDKLADLALVHETCDRLGSQATLHVVDGADHGFHVLQRSGRTDDEVIDELVSTTVSFCRILTEGQAGGVPNPP